MVSMETKGKQERQLWKRVTAAAVEEAAKNTIEKLKKKLGVKPFNEDTNFVIYFIIV